MKNLARRAPTPRGARIHWSLGRVGVCSIGALLLASCGAGLGGTDDDPPCRLNIIVETATPLTGVPVSVRATASESGFLEVNWGLDLDGQPIACSDDTSGLCLGRSIVFLPEMAGPHSIQITGSVDGGSCVAAATTVNVGVPGADVGMYRIVVTPSQSASPLAEEILIPAGADYALGEFQLPAGAEVSGTVEDNGSPVESHLVVRGSNGARGAEAFSDAAGTFAATFPAGTINLDVLPADLAIAPGRFHDIAANAVGELALPAADAITGAVRGPTGAGLELASISIALDGLPSSLATSAADGSYSLAVRQTGFGVGAATEVTVQPPETSGLPTLRGPIATAASAQTLNVEYASSVSVRTRMFTVTGDGGTPVADAEVMFVSEPFLSAATVEVQGGALTNVDGRVHKRAATSAAGVISSIVLADAIYTVYVSPPAGLPSVLTLDATGANTPALVTTDQRARLSLRLLQTGSVPDPDVRVVARPTGPLVTLAPVVTTVSAADGTAFLDVVGGGHYDIRIYRRSANGLAQTRVQSVVAPEPGSDDVLGDVLRRVGRKIGGNVVFASGAPASRAHIAIHCIDCEQPDLALGETVANDSGEFVLLLPDPDLSSDF